ADEAGQNAQDSAFGARGNQPRRWRLGIQAAVARTFFHRKHAGLPLETKDGTVDIWLSGEYTCVIHQVAGGKVVRSIGYDLEVAEKFQGVVAAQRRSQSARADAQHARSLQLLLTLHADLRHDQVARIAQDFVVSKGRGGGLDFG